MRITESAVMQAISFTENARQSLESNYVHMQNTTMPYLAEWKDANVQRFNDMMELFDSYVKRTAASMDEIASIMRNLLRMMEEYNN